MSIDNLMHALFAGKPGTFNIEFDKEMQSRINDRIDDYKGFVKANFDNPEAEYPGYQPDSIESNETNEDEVDNG